MTAPSQPLSHHRRVRSAGYAGLAWTFFQLTVLAVSGGDNAWAWQPLLINVLPPLLLTIALLRGSLVAAVLLGVYGLYRVVSCLMVFARLLTGTAAGNYDGLVGETVVVLVFALFWVSGGLAAFQLPRLRWRIEGLRD
jgi:hypothetical protein